MVQREPSQVQVQYQVLISWHVPTDPDELELLEDPEGLEFELLDEPDCELLLLPLD